MAPAKRRGGTMKKAVKKSNIIKAHANQVQDFSARSMVAKIHTQAKGPIPVELLELVFMKLDPLSQHAFGVANKHFRRIFLDKYEENYGLPYGSLDEETDYPYKRFIPVRMMDKFDEPGYHPFVFRNIMRCWIPADHVWVPSSGKYLGGELVKLASEELVGAVLGEFNKIIRYEENRLGEWEDANYSFNSFQNQRRRLYLSRREEHREMLMQTHLAEMEYGAEENMPDDEHDDDNYGYPFDYHLDEEFQDSDVPEGFEDSELEEVEAPGPWVEFEDPDDAPLVAENDPNADIEMRDLPLEYIDSHEED